jgi:hypothetical protein
MYSTITFKDAEICVVVYSHSVLAVDNFKTRVLQQFAEFFTRI